MVVRERGAGHFPTVAAVADDGSLVCPGDGGADALAYESQTSVWKSSYVNDFDCSWDKQWVWLGFFEVDGSCVWICRGELTEASNSR